MSPPRLKRWIIKIHPVSFWVFVVFTITSLTYSLYLSPLDYLHGDLVRILYLHVPAAWLALGIYAAMGLCSFISLVLRSPFYSLCAQSLALPGCILTAVCMLTGSLWGKPAWGAWWVWDARLTSVVILLFFYVGYINISDGMENKAASILNIVGFINLPIIKWSVDWWFTLHQPSSFSMTQKPAIATEMLIPLALMLITFIAWSLTVFSKRFIKLLEIFQKNNYV